jgi:hypothetical protein
MLFPGNSSETAACRGFAIRVSGQGACGQKKCKKTQKKRSDTDFVKVIARLTLHLVWQINKRRDISRTGMDLHSGIRI